MISAHLRPQHFIIFVLFGPNKLQDRRKNTKHPQFRMQAVATTNVKAAMFLGLDCKGWLWADSIQSGSPANPAGQRRGVASHGDAGSGPKVMGRREERALPAARHKMNYRHLSAPLPHSGEPSLQGQITRAHERRLEGSRRPGVGVRWVWGALWVEGGEGKK